MSFSPADIERIIKTELAGQWDRNQLDSGDRRFDAFVRSDGLRIAQILEFLPTDRPFRVLEVGVGYGYVVTAISRFFPHATILAVEAPGRDYVAIESFKRMLAAARTTLTACDITAQPLPYAADSFDRVIFSEIIEHLPPQAIPGVLAEIQRTLKSRGELILTTPNAVRLRNRLRFLLGKGVFESPTRQIGGTYGHLREYTEVEVVAMLSSTGFREVRSVKTRIPFPIVDSRAEKFISRLGGWLTVLSPTFQDLVCVRAVKG